MLKQTLALCALTLMPLFAQADLMYQIGGNVVLMTKDGIKFNNEMPKPFCLRTQQVILGASEEKSVVTADGECFNVIHTDYRRFLAGWGTTETVFKFCPNSIIRNDTYIPASNQLGVARALDKLMCDGQQFLAKTLKASN